MRRLRGMKAMFVLLILAATACTGAYQPSTVAPTPTAPLDPAVARDWFQRGQALTDTVSRMYFRGQMSTEALAQERDAAQALADEIREAVPPSEPALAVADSLNQLVGALEFVLEFAENAGYNVSGVQFPTLEEALSQLTKDLMLLQKALP